MSKKIINSYRPQKPDQTKRKLRLAARPFRDTQRARPITERKGNSWTTPGSKMASWTRSVVYSAPPCGAAPPPYVVPARPITERKGEPASVPANRRGVLQELLSLDPSLVIRVGSVGSYARLKPCPLRLLVARDGCEGQGGRPASGFCHGAPSRGVALVPGPGWGTRRTAATRPLPLRVPAGVSLSRAVLL